MTEHSHELHKNYRWALIAVQINTGLVDEAEQSLKGVQKEGGEHECIIRWPR